MGDGLLYRRMHHSLVGGQVELDPGQATPRLHRPAVVDTAFYLETIPRNSDGNPLLRRRIWSVRPPRAK